MALSQTRHPWDKSRENLDASAAGAANTKVGSTQGTVQIDIAVVAGEHF